MTIHFLELNNTPILEQLQIEEALLRADTRNWCITNYGSSNAIVMGISGKYDEMIEHEKMALKQVPVIRRFSGGGTVFVDHNTCFITFICNSPFVNIEPYPHAIMQWTDPIYRPLIPQFEIQENDYVVNRKKFGGNAQSICKKRWLHHSSLLWDYSDTCMEYLKHPKRQPKYREERSHSDFLCSLKAYWPCKETFFQDFKNNIKKMYEVKQVDIHEVNEVLKIPHRKATEMIFI